MFIDTHTHLFSDAFDEDRIEVVNRAINAGVEKLLLPNIDVPSLNTMLELHQAFPTNCLPMFGLHPGSVEENVEENLKIIKQTLIDNLDKAVAIGEIGMDLYWDKTYQMEQAYAFREQIRWAKEFKLPIVIHVREAFEELFTILDIENDENLTGVFHCFTGNLEQAQHALGYGGFKLGIGGVLTYKKSELPEVIKQIPLSNIVLETDSPYLPPVPFRGKRNESSYILHTAEKLSEIYNVPLKEIEEITTQNAIELFNLK
ncbi:MAG TPA: TatD family hydrolase [Taishania sp.]|nr:TatD family hydrolase [Taishania sp.]